MAELLRMVRLRQVDPDVYRVAGFFKSPRRMPEPFFYSNGVAVVPAPADKTDSELLEMVYSKGEWLGSQWAPAKKRVIHRLPEIGVKWAAPLFDGSGYAEAARNYVAALSTANVPVTIQPVTFEVARSDYGMAGRITEASRKPVPYGFKIIMMTPDYFHKHREEGCYNIGLFLWETNMLPKEWVPSCNQMDEIWVCCQWNADVSRESGVKVPIKVFGCTTNEESFDHVHPYKVPGLDPKAYKFYSVFQWTERKNPKGLLYSYLTAFTRKENVALILKTYRSNYSQKEQDEVKKAVEEIKREVGGENQPPVYLISWMLTKQEMLGLHKLGDCFSLIHRSEGWGMPHHEACLAGRPVITTNFGGNLEFTKPEHSYLVDYRLARVEGMPHIPWYRRDMFWAAPDVPQCRDFMRHVYKERLEASLKGRDAQTYVRKNFSWAAIGGAMRARLEEIQSKLEV
jgi:hypothetical protein